MAARRPVMDPAEALALLEDRWSGPGEEAEAGNPLDEPGAATRPEWQQRVLAQLAQAGRLELADVTGGTAWPSLDRIRPFLRYLEREGLIVATSWTVADRGATRRLQRFANRRQLIASYRAGRVARAEGRPRHDAASRGRPA
jgi:hypothetical protein